MIHAAPRASGTRSPPGSAVVARRAAMTSDEAIVQFGKERGWEFLGHLGFTTRWGLGKATDSRVFRRIDGADFETRVGRWVGARLGRDDAPHLTIDGTTARGRRDGGTPGVHLVSASAPDANAVLAQLRVDAKTNETSTQPRWNSWRTRRRSARTARRPSPSPRPAFPPFQTARRAAEVERACEVDTGHGRVAPRTMEFTSSRAEYLGSDWPGCAPVFRLTRVRTTGAEVEPAVVLGITSLPRACRGAGVAEADPRPWGHRVRSARGARRDAA